MPELILEIGSSGWFYYKEMGSFMFMVALLLLEYLLIRIWPPDKAALLLTPVLKSKG